MSDDNGMTHQTRETIVEEGSEFSGKLHSKVDVLARGRLEGEITAPSLSISTTGAVHGKVKVASLQSEGEVSGELEADTMRLAGAVRDHTVLKARTLEVRLPNEAGKDPVVFGECELQVGDVPADDKATAKKPSKGKGRKAQATEPEPAVLASGHAQPELDA